MTHRERVISSIEHKNVDKIPVLLWIEPHTTLNLMKYVHPPKSVNDKFSLFIIDHLSEILSLTNIGQDIENALILFTYTGQADYMLQLGADMVDVFWGNPLLMFRGLKYKNGKFIGTDFYGLKRKIVGRYLENVEAPIKNIKDLKTYSFPNMSSKLFFNNIRSFRKKHPEVAINAHCFGLQDFGSQLTGMENYYKWLIDYPEEMKNFLSRLTKHAIQQIRGSAQAGADVITILDDYGTQKGLFISPAMWEEFIYPSFKRLVEEIHNCGKKAMLHSDGYIMPLLDYFISAKLDALHPIQPNCNNDLKFIKEKYGSKIAIVSGIDVQKIPFLSPEEVEKDINYYINLYSPGSGFILCTTNALQADTSIENLKVILKVIKNLGAFN